MHEQLMYMVCLGLAILEVYRMSQKIKRITDFDTMYVE